MVAVLLLAARALSGADGTVTGQLADPQGKPVADAKVSMAQNGDSRAQETRTSSNGEYTFPSIPTGTYKLAAAAQGFVDVNPDGFAIPDGAALTG